MPTIKQKKAFKNTLENGGVISRAMEEADYSPAMAKNPQKLTESKGWQELMDEHLPDSLLAERHKELLNKRESVVYGGSDGKPQALDMGPETQAVTKGLDMAYKLKGSYAPEKSQAVNLNIKGDIKDFSELDAIRIKYEGELKEKLIK